MTKFIFQKTLIIGVGLIGSSIARALRERNISSEIHGVDTSANVLAKCDNLNILSSGKKDLNDYSCQFDLIIICSPLSTYKKIFSSLNKFVTKPTLVTDVGSTKMSVIQDYQDTCSNQYVKFVPVIQLLVLRKAALNMVFLSFLKIVSVS